MTLGLRLKFYQGSGDIWRVLRARYGMHWADSRNERAIRRANGWRWMEYLCSAVSALVSYRNSVDMHCHHECDAERASMQVPWEDGGVSMQVSRLIIRWWIAQ